MPNGHAHPPHPPHPPQHAAPTNHRAHTQAPKERINVQAVPSVTVQNNELVVGDSNTSSVRSYTPLKVVGDGSFGTVWLCDWHGTLPPNTPVSAMQCGPGARPEYAGKRLVAVKRMKKTWEGGWDECKKLKELESLRAIAYHPNIIPLYDFFLLPDTKELYFVFESMEGNLYQLIKTRKGKPLAGGLVSSIFRQVVSGLHHIHESGYFHRDMKPENLLVTTTGLYDYRPVSPYATPDSPPESDVVVIVKLADFGLARETKSEPPYTEYVSTRWYRAPEVLLKSKHYSNPVDMWALGTIMAELVNLRPLFPGQGEVDQVSRICELLGDPGRDYGLDGRGKPIGGGKWPKGVKMARAVGFQFPEIPPRDFYALFDRSVPMKLVECIADLLKYDPDLRLTSQQCVDHPYLAETTPLNNPPGPPGSQTAANGNGLYARANGVSSARSLPSVTPRSAPPSHSHNSLPGRPEFEPQPGLATVQIPEVSSSHRSSFYESRSRAQSEARGLPTYPQDAVHGVRVPNGVSPSQSQAPSEYSNGWPSYASDSHGAWDPMDISPQVEIPPDGFPHSMDIQTSPMVREHPQRPAVEDPIQNGANGHIQEAAQQASGKLGKFSFTRKTSKWGLGMFGHGDKGQQGLPPVQEIPVVGSASSTPSLKRTQSSSTDSRSLSELSPLQEVPRIITDPKQRKKEAARIQRDAEKQRRLLAEKTQKEQARAVMEKSKRIRDTSGDFEWRSTHAVALLHGPSQAYTQQILSGKQPAAAAGPIRQTQSHGVSSFSAAGGSFASPSDANPRGDWRRDERVAKARRRDYDDDHSMSSTDLPSGVSVISFATVDSDPGPARLRHRPSALGISRMTSMSSLGTTMSEEFSPHARSSTSLAMEQQFANDFHLRASVDSSSISDGGSPAVAPLHMLSLSSPIPWAHQENGENTGERPSLNIPPQPKHPTGFQPQGPLSPYEHGQGNGLGYPSSPGVAPKSAINPMFKVPPISTTILSRPGSLPPFAHLEAVAEGEYPPLSPMSFTTPDDMANDFS
ncbi:kinase-like protein [Trametes versicolor FP-101664 SS1]|uniref:kinase-like protein n=1 Tax=Trametes versicolor (strain FP-101664) TaxID=717944 RepID=UPI000462226E|nr:kinase-like protein [Trametes versicolor FP-101664 SS1]EIW64653.1 kinase-like protein [Trametes versicolor FP-101664 SS1]